MIVLVTERINGDVENHFYNLLKFNIAIPFELAYYSAITKAILSKDKSVCNPVGIEDRFGDYSEGTEKIESLRVRPPCLVDYAITLWVED